MMKVKITIYPGAVADEVDPSAAIDPDGPLDDVDYFDDGTYTRYETILIEREDGLWLLGEFDSIILHGRDNNGGIQNIRSNSNDFLKYAVELLKSASDITDFDAEQGEQSGTFLWNNLIHNIPDDKVDELLEEDADTKIVYARNDDNTKIILVNKSKNITIVGVYYDGELVIEDKPNWMNDFVAMGLVQSFGDYILYDDIAMRRNSGSIYADWTTIVAQAISSLPPRYMSSKDVVRMFEDLK